MWPSLLVLEKEDGGGGVGFGNLTLSASYFESLLQPA